MHPDYFEGILQLRNPTSEVVSFVEKFDDHISKVRQVTNGIDYYFVSQRFLRSLGKALQRRFPGKLVSTRSIHTRNRQTSKDVYRVTVLFRCFPFRKGDLVESRGETYLVLAVGKKVYVQHSKTREKKLLDYDKLLP
jgi:NMD protein affecting ribosome stability and mRNA decay